jgi:hypothetical protein
MIDMATGRGAKIPQDVIDQYLIWYLAQVSAA